MPDRRRSPRAWTEPAVASAHECPAPRSTAQAGRALVLFVSSPSPRLRLAGDQSRPNAGAGQWDLGAMLESVTDSQDRRTTASRRKELTCSPWPLAAALLLGAAPAF